MTVPADRLPLLDASAALGKLPTASVGAGTPKALVATLDHYGMAAAVVSHTDATYHEPAGGNRRLVTEIADQPRLHGCWTILPDGCRELPPPPELLEQAVGHRVRMLTARPAAHGYRLGQADLGPLLAGAADRGLPLLLELAQTSFEEVGAVARDHPDLIMILTEVGYRSLRQLCGLLTDHPGVRVTTANLSGHLALEYLVDRFGADRVVFGTGHPLRDPGEAVTRLLLSDLDEAAARRVAGDTLRELLGLPTGEAP